MIPTPQSPAQPLPSRLEEAATQLARNWASRLLCDPLPDSIRPATLDEAYTVQDRVIAISSLKPAGWKLAITEAAAQHRNAISEPITGQLFSDGFFPSPAKVDVAAFPEKRIMMECEIGVRMGSISATGPGQLPGGHKNSVQSVFVCVELPALRFRDLKTMGAATFSADNAGAFRVVMGKEAPIERLQYLDEKQVCVTVNDVVIATAKVGDITMPPAAALTWLSKHLERRGKQLQPNEVILTGALTGLHPLAVGDRVIAEIETLGSVELEIV